MKKCCYDDCDNKMEDDMDMCSKCDAELTEELKDMELEDRLSVSLYRYFDGVDDKG